MCELICVRCVLKREEERRPAVAIYNGHSWCEEHLEQSFETQGQQIRERRSAGNRS